MELRERRLWNGVLTELYEHLNLHIVRANAIAILSRTCSIYLSFCILCVFHVMLLIIKN